MEIIFLKNFEAFAHCLLASEVAVENSDAILVLHIFRVKPVAISSLDASRNFFLKNKFIYVFIYLWLHWVFVAVCGLSLVAASGGYSLLQFMGFSLWWLLLLQSTGSRRTGFSSCGTWAQ